MTNLLTASKPSDLKVCECSHEAYHHPTKKAAKSQWRDKCSVEGCGCKRFRIATNKQVDGKWVPDTRVVSGKTFKQELLEEAKARHQDFLNKEFRPKHVWFIDTFTPRRIWP